MKLFNRRSNSSHLRGLVIALGASMLIAACGGGGGGGGGDAPGGGGGGTLTGWQGAQLLETTDGQPGTTDVAVNAAGVGYAVWRQRNLITSRSNIVSSRYVNGVWEAPQLVSAEIAVNMGASDPKVFVHPDGRATAVWRQPGFNGTEDIVGSTTGPDGKWPALNTIQAGNVAVARSLQLVSDGHGNGTVLWTVGQTVFASAFRGTTFQLPEQISEATDRDALNPKVVMRTDVPGQALVAWHEKDIDDNNISKVFVRVFDGNAWRNAVKLSRTGAPANQPEVSFGTAGRAIVTYVQVETTGNALTARTSSNVVSGQWDLPRTLDTVAGSRPHAVVMDAQGRAVSVYERSGLTQNETRTARYDGVNWKDGGKLKTEDLGAASLVRLAVDASGRTFAVWEQASTNTPIVDVMANRMDPAAGVWGAAERIETENGGSASTPLIAVNASGLALSVWKQKNGILDSDGQEIQNVMANVFR